MALSAFAVLAGPAAGAASAAEDTDSAPRTSAETGTVATGTAAQTAAAQTAAAQTAAPEPSGPPSSTTPGTTAGAEEGDVSTKEGGADGAPSGTPTTQDGLGDDPKDASQPIASTTPAEKAVTASPSAPDPVVTPSSPSSSRTGSGGVASGGTVGGAPTYTVPACASGDSDVSAILDLGLANGYTVGDQIAVPLGGGGRFCSYTVRAGDPGAVPAPEGYTPAGPPLTTESGECPHLPPFSDAARDYVAFSDPAGVKPGDVLILPAVDGVSCEYVLDDSDVAAAGSAVGEFPTLPDDPDAPTGSDPTGSDPTGSDPTGSDPTGSDPAGGESPGSGGAGPGQSTDGGRPPGSVVVSDGPGREGGTTAPASSSSGLAPGTSVISFPIAAATTTATTTTATTTTAASTAPGDATTPVGPVDAGDGSARRGEPDRDAVPLGTAGLLLLTVTGSAAYRARARRHHSSGGNR